MTMSNVQVSLLLCGLALFCPCFVNGVYTTADVEGFGKLCNASKEDIATVAGHEIPSSEAGKCFLKCMSDKIQMTDSDGVYNYAIVHDTLKKYFPERTEEMLKKINDVCYENALQIKSLTELGPCDYEYKLFLCLNNQYKINHIY